MTGVRTVGTAPPIAERKECQHGFVAPAVCPVCQMIERVRATEKEDAAMRRVILESPYGNDDAVIVAANVEYARSCARDCLMRQEAPIASHLVFPFFLDDKIPEERALGIEAGLAWIPVAHAMVLYVDRGISRGMQAARERAESIGLEVVLRSLEAEQ